MPDCALSQGFAIGCRSDAGSGIKALYLVEFNSSDVVTKASGEVTAHTLATGRVYFKYELEKNLSTMKWTIKSSRPNGTVVYGATVSAKILGMTTALRNELKLLAKTNARLIVRDNTDTYWLLGADTGVDMGDSEVDFGTEMGSFKGATINLNHEESDLPAKLQAAVIEDLELV